MQAETPFSGTEQATKPSRVCQTKEIIVSSILFLFCHLSLLKFAKMNGSIESHMFCEFNLPVSKENFNHKGNPFLAEGKDLSNN